MIQAYIIIQRRNSKKEKSTKKDVTVVIGVLPSNVKWQQSKNSEEMELITSFEPTQINLFVTNYKSLVYYISNLPWIWRLLA